MDPEETLLLAEEAFEISDYDVALDYLDEYRAWRERGGFEPEDGDGRESDLRIAIGQAMRSKTMTTQSNRNKKCPPGEIERAGYTRKGYTRKDGTRVKKTRVPASCIPDQGRPGKTTKKPPWIRREGKLGGPGYTDKSAKQRHKILKDCVDRYGYRSCLGSLMVLLRNTEIQGKTRKTLEADKNWLVKNYGGEGSFGPQKNPEDACCSSCAIGAPCEAGCATSTKTLKNKLLK